MKKCFMLLAAALLTMSMSAADLTGKKFYLNPGHGSFGPNDRPAATIPYPELPTTGMPDTCGFYESNTNLQKAWYLGQKLMAAGAIVQFSHTECGPWDYEKANGDYPDYTWAEYQKHPDIEKYNRDLAEICEEVEAGNFDYFISIHSNAATEGANINYPLYLYRGHDEILAEDSINKYKYVPGSYEMAAASWPHRNEIMLSGIDPSSYYNKPGQTNLRGDINFYSSSTPYDRTLFKGTEDSVTYFGYLGVLHHGAPGFLVEGYFHTYQPARHRALNYEYCHMEGLAYYRGIVDYYGAEKEKVGYIMGTVKDKYNKMTNKLYNYIPKTNDQWVPCNGAEVILKKGGVEVARYNVDTCYNGLFIFKNLEPGDDYTLEASCPGFLPMEEEYKAPISVKANETTYPMIYLVDSTWTPPTVVYEDYPNPVQPAYLGVPGTFAMKAEAVRDYTAAIKGTVKRTIQSGDSTIILSLEEDGTPHIYLIESAKDSISSISTNGIIARDPDNVGDYLALSDIALTCDGKLAAVNYLRTQYGDGQVDAGYKRGVKTFYLWDTLSDDPHVWFTANDAANSYRSEGGYTLAIMGASNDCQVLVSQRHYNATSGGGALRYSCYSVTDNIPTYIYYGYSISAEENPPMDASRDGENIQFTLSPRGEKKDFIFDADKVTPTEFRLPGAQGSDVIILGKVSTDLLNVKFNGSTYFKYAGHSLMAAPKTDADGKVIGVQVLDITDGLDKAKLIKTTNTTLDTPVEAAYAAATAKVVDADLYLYLLVDGKMYTFTTKGQTQPAIAAISAYKLNVTEEGNNYIFSFEANADANAASILFYDAEGVEVGSVALNGVVKGTNNCTVAKKSLPGAQGQTFTWALKLEGDAIGNWGRIHHTPLANLKADASTAMVRPFISINNNPESDYFQYLYVMDRQGSGNAKSGLHAFTPDYKQINTAPLKGGRDMYGSPYRSFVDDQGYIWISDGRDATSGIIVADPANLEGTYEEFFVFDNRLTTTDYAGLLTNNGVDVGSSSVGLSVYGTGKDAKLLTINEDAGTWLKHMSLVIYNIGTEEGTYQHSWDSLPSAQIELKGMAAIDGYPLGCSHGVWIATNRSSGNNNSSATALQFYDWEGTRQLSSAEAPYKDLIDGCAGGACALNEDESVLYMIDGSQNLLVWDIVWEGNKPVMTLRYSYKCGMSSIREMHLDYAGNLVCSGDKGTGIVVFSIPSEENVTVIPAKKALTVTKVVPKYTVTAVVNDATMGTIEGLVEGGVYSEDTEVTLTATANEGYEFVCWTAGADTVSTAATYTFTVTADLSLVANFKKIIKYFNVTATSNIGEAAIFTGLGTYEEGAEVTIVADANEGYRFESWTQGKQVVSTEATYTFVITQDIDLYATFVTLIDITDAMVLINEQNATIGGMWGDKPVAISLSKFEEVPSKVYPSAIFTCGEGDDLFFLTGAAEATIEGELLTVTGVFNQKSTSQIYDVIISGKLPTDPGTGVDDINTTVAPTKVMKNGQLIIIKDGVEYSAQGAVVK